LKIEFPRRVLAETQRRRERRGVVVVSEWKECKLQELALFQRGHDLSKAEMKDGAFPVAGSNGVIGYHNIASTKGPGITIGRSGNIGTPHFYKTDFWAHNTVLYVKDFYSNDEKYVYYFLTSFDFKSFNAGSAVPTLNRNHIHELLIKVPPLHEQKAIAGVLSSLDDKIDLLHRQNKTLDAMAKTLFRQWFVEEASEDWEEVVITDLFEIKDGTHDSPKPKEYGKKLITSKYLSENKIDFNNAYYISEVEEHGYVYFATELREVSASYDYYAERFIDEYNELQ